MLSQRSCFCALSTVFAVPLLMGQGCPTTVSPFDTAVSADDSVELLIVSVATISTTATPTLLTFNPVEAGKLVTLTIKSNTTGSRPAVRIVDPQNNLVAVQDFPTAPKTTVSFMSTTTGAHQVQLREIGMPGSLYQVLVVQQP